METSSKTALMVAAFRARASAKPDPICSDPWAAALAGDEGERLADDLLLGFPAIELWLALRTAYLDALVEYVTAPSIGVQQIVLLGAGFDTRAARLARPGVRFYEVDHPATQADKRARVAALDGYPIDAATYVGCNFEIDDFVERLVASGADVSTPMFFIWEGVVPYLTEPAVRATLGKIARLTHPRSILVFDTVGKRLAAGDRISAQDAHAKRIVSQVGEPVIFGTNHPLPMLFEEGFRDVRTITFDEICLMFTQTYRRDRMFRFQHISIASRSALGRI